MSHAKQARRELSAQDRAASSRRPSTHHLPTAAELACSVCRTLMAGWLVGNVRFCRECLREAGAGA